VVIANAVPKGTCRTSSFSLFFFPWPLRKRAITPSLEIQDKSTYIFFVPVNVAGKTRTSVEKLKELIFGLHDTEYENDKGYQKMAKIVSLQAVTLEQDFFLSTLYNKSIFFFILIFPPAKNERFGYLSLLGGDIVSKQQQPTTIQSSPIWNQLTCSPSGPSVSDRK